MSPLEKIACRRLQINDELIDSVVDAAISTVKNYFGVSSELESQIETNEPFRPEFGDRSVTGVSAFIQQQIEGVISISMDRGTLSSMVGEIFSEEGSGFQSGVLEAIGEITNVVHGQVKKDLSWKGFNFTMCLPVVVIGANHTVFSPIGGKRVILKFKSDKGAFTIDIHLYSYDEKGVLETY